MSSSEITSVSATSASQMGRLESILITTEECASLLSAVSKRGISALSGGVDVDVKFRSIVVLWSGLERLKRSEGVSSS